jgi:threonine dehydratase
VADVADVNAGPMFTLDELDGAGALVHAHVPPTPQFAWPLLAAEVGAEVVVKHENHTPAGAFKVRGGLVYLDRLLRERPGVRGLVSATRGNHGQSLAYAGRVHGVPVTIVVPHGNSVEKNAAMRAFGADLIEHGHDFQAAREHARRLAVERGLEMVDSFHRALVLGVATYARELFDAVADLDVVYVPIGLGSGICGMITVRDLLGLRTDIVGVVAEGAPTYLRSIEAGHAVPSERADTFADGVACRVPDEHALAVITTGAARVVAVSDDAIAEAVRILHRTTHNTAEPAGAAALAGALAERDLIAGRRVGVILTGGNVDIDVHAAVLSGHTPRP